MSQNCEILNESAFCAYGGITGILEKNDINCGCFLQAVSNGNSPYAGVPDLLEHYSGEWVCC